MAMFEDGMEVLDDAELENLGRRLARAEEDLRERIAGRVVRLGGADSPISDPLHQRLHFIHRDLHRQKVTVEAELARRAGMRAIGETCLQ
jgi:hypothetical protein